MAQGLEDHDFGLSSISKSQSLFDCEAKAKLTKILDSSQIIKDQFDDLYTKDTPDEKELQKYASQLQRDSCYYFKKCLKYINKVYINHYSLMNQYQRLEDKFKQEEDQKSSVTSQSEILSNNSKPNLRQLYSDIGDSSDNLEESKTKLPKMLSLDFDGIDDNRNSPSYLESRFSFFHKDKSAPHFSLPTFSSMQRLKVLDHDESSAKEAVKGQLCCDDENQTSAFTLSSIFTNQSTLLNKPTQTYLNDIKYINLVKPKHEKKSPVKSSPLLLRQQSSQSLQHLIFQETRFEAFFPNLEGEDQGDCKFNRKSSSSLTTETFQAHPDVVRFTNWQVGKTYETTLDIRNISSRFRKLRVSPPKTANFSISLEKYSSTCSGLAPGMKITFDVRFVPDAMTDYKDVIIAYSTENRFLIVKILAERVFPDLAIEKVIDCGHCLIGGAKVLEIPVKNVGGKGEFCLMKKSSSNVKISRSSQTLHLESFKIYPKTFELFPHETRSLYVAFFAKESKLCEEEIKVVSDNILKEITIQGTGQRAGVDLIKDEIISNDHRNIDESRDLSANHFLRFSNLIAGVCETKQIAVKNLTDLSLSYLWRVLNPNLVTTDKFFFDDKGFGKENLDFCPDYSDIYIVSPKQGVLQPQQTRVFNVTFTPAQLGTHVRLIHLVLQNIPSSFINLREDVSSMHVQSSTTANLNKQSTLDITCSDFAHILDERDQFLKDVSAIEIELAGACREPRLSLWPPFVSFSSPILLETSSIKFIKLFNEDLYPVPFRWINNYDPNIVEVNPGEGILESKSWEEFEVRVTGLCVGFATADVLCYVGHSCVPLLLKVEAVIDGPSVTIDNTSVDFGVMRVGDMKMKKLRLRNLTQLKTEWQLITRDDERQMVIYPLSGVLNSLEKKEVKIKFAPKFAQSFNTFIALEINQGRSSSVLITSEVVKPQACFNQCTIELNEVYISLPAKMITKLQNLTGFLTPFKFGKVVGNPYVEISVTPSEGILLAKEEKIILFNFVCHHEGVLGETYLPCFIDGSKQPIILSFVGTVKYLKIDIYIPDCKNSTIDFVGPVQVNEKAHSRIIMKNQSKIKTFWSTTVRNFPVSSEYTKYVDEEKKKLSCKKSLLKQSTYKSVEQIKSEKERFILSANEGAALLLEPSSGVLEPHEMLEIQVTAFNNMWGVYQDEIIFHVKDACLKKIPVQLNVVGCPLHFEMNYSKQNNTLLDFGTLVKDGCSRSRSLKINNRSFADIRLDWRVYNYLQSDARKLLNFYIWFGEPFPVDKGQLQLQSRSSVYNKRSSKFNLRCKSNFLLSNTKKASGCSKKLINVAIKEYIGPSADAPFALCPPQVVVSALDSVTITATFSSTASMYERSNHEQFKSLAYGYVSLDDSNLKYQPGKVRRLDGYFADPLRLDLQASVSTGYIRIQHAGDEGDPIKFLISLNSFANMNSADETVHSKECLFLNDGKADQIFDVSVKHPFYLATSSGVRRNNRHCEIKVMQHKKRQIKIEWL